MSAVIVALGGAVAGALVGVLIDRARRSRARRRRRAATPDRASLPPVPPAAWTTPPTTIHLEPRDVVRPSTRRAGRDRRVVLTRRRRHP